MPFSSLTCLLMMLYLWILGLLYLSMELIHINPLLLLCKMLVG